MVLLHHSGFAVCIAPPIRAWTRSKRDGHCPACVVSRLMLGGVGILPPRSGLALGGAHRDC